jgi:hypothetical protein
MYMLRYSIANKLKQVPASADVSKSTRVHECERAKRAGRWTGGNSCTCMSTPMQHASALRVYYSLPAVLYVGESDPSANGHQALHAASNIFRVTSTNLQPQQCGLSLNPLNAYMLCTGMFGNVLWGRSSIPYTLPNISVPGVHMHIYA